MTRITTLLSPFLLCAAVLTACGGTNDSPPDPALSTPNGQSSMTGMPAPESPGAQPSESQIVMSNMAYTVPTSVRPGQQLTIVNRDDPNHTVTADDNSLFDTRISGGGGIKSFTAPTTPGTYPFHCKYHANMHGMLTVE